MTVATEHFRFVQRLVLETSAIMLSDDKNYLVETRLAPLARNLGLSSVEGVVEKLRQHRDPLLERQVVEAMTTNETSWFRDRKPFDALRHYIIPELLGAKAACRSLRIWSAACASGQELFSVAMLLEEHFPELRQWDVELIGTDINSEMVERSRQGLFSSLEVNRGLPAPLLARYFQQEGRSWRAGAVLRSRTRFTQLNLVKMWPALPTFDIVMLRNVLIYFDPPAKAHVLNRVTKQMTNTGYLLMGSGESPSGLNGELQPVCADGTVFYQRNGCALT